MQSGRSNRTLWVLAAIIALLRALAALATTAQAEPPQSPARSLLEQVRRLQRSGTPEARAVLQQIEDGPKELAKQREAARMEGLPLTPQDLKRGELPPEQNAAPEYTRLMQLLREKPLDRQADRAAGELAVRTAHPPEAVAAVRTMLAERRDVMDLVHQAAGRPRCVFPRQWELGPAVPFPEFATMREAARLLRAESYLLARDGKWDEAVAAQARGFRLAEHAASDPIFIAYLVGIAIDSLALDGMENILYLAGAEREAAAVAEKVQATIAARRPRLSFQYALRGEVALAPVSLEMVRKGGPAGYEQAVFGAPASRKKLSPEEERLWSHLMDAAEADYLRRMRRLARVADRPYPERRAVLREEEGYGGIESGNPILTINALVFPVFAKAGPSGAQARASEEAVMAGAAVLAYRAPKGAYPDRLAEALPQPPVDPFTGQPLKYRREGQGFVVYSAGPEGAFAGGKPGDVRMAGQAFFRYPAPAPVPPPSRN